MKNFEVKDFINYLIESGLTIRVGVLLVIAMVLFVALMFYRSSRKQTGPDVADIRPVSKPEAPTPVAKKAPVVAATSSQPGPASTPKRETAPEPALTPEPEIASTPAFTPKPEATQASRSHVPQDSILRRHFVTHVRYMLETVTFPRPTEMVLRRHYDQLIASQLEACLEDEAELNKLIRRYDETRKKRFANSI